MDVLQQWGEMGIFWDVHNCILEQGQESDAAQGMTCQEQVVIVQSQTDKGSERPRWREMTEVC